MYPYPLYSKKTIIFPILPVGEILIFWAYVYFEYFIHYKPDSP